MPIVQLTVKECRLLAVTLAFAEGGMIAQQSETRLVSDVVDLRNKFKALVPPGEGDGEPVQAEVKAAVR